jgi:hypothetical protein
MGADTSEAEMQRAAEECHRKGGRPRKLGARTASGQLIRAQGARGVIGEARLNALEFYVMARSRALSGSGVPRGSLSPLNRERRGDPMPDDKIAEWAWRYRKMNAALTQAERFAVYDVGVANRPPSSIQVLIDGLDRLVELIPTLDKERKEMVATQTKTVQVEIKNTLTRKLAQLESKIDRLDEDVRKAFIATAILATQQRSMS